MSTLRVNNIQSVTDGSVTFPQGSISSQPVTFPSGNASNPSISFTGDTDTGLYRIDANTIGISTNGSEKARIDNNGLEVIDGTASNPSISFINDLNTGLFRSASDQLDIVTGGDTRFRIEATGQIKAVYESTLGTDYNTSANLHNGYLCRAWVNFNGSTVVSPASATGIRGSGNVSTILDGGFGQYTINFTIPMPDANYAVCVGGSNSGGDSFVPTVRGISAWASTAGSCRYTHYRTDINAFDVDQTLAHVAVFR